MTKFRQKNFGGSASKTLNYIKKHPTLPISGAALGISGANLASNQARRKESRELANKQIDTLNKQINIISDNTKALQENSKLQKETLQQKKPIETTKQVTKKKRFKLFSIKSDTLAGATLGLSVGTLGTAYLPDKLSLKRGVKFRPLRKEYNALSKFQKKSIGAAAGMIIGAALGALVGTIKEIDNKFSRKSVTNDRLMKTILENLNKDHFKEGTDYTRNPKLADFLQTKVCVAITRSNGDLRILINTKADPKLRDLTDRITKNIPNAGAKNTFANNKYNELTITTISDSSADATLVSGIVSQFIHSGYPVYLVEVG